MSTRDELRKTVAELPVLETIVLDPEDEPPPPLPTPTPSPRPSAPQSPKKLTKAELKEQQLKEQQADKITETRFNMHLELEMSKRSAARGLADWRDMCRDIKLEEMRANLDEWLADVEQKIHHKDELIKVLIGDIDEIKKVRKRSFETHAQLLQYMTDVHKCFLDVYRQLYIANCTGAIEDFYDDFNEWLDCHHVEKVNRENIMHCSNMIFENSLATDLKIHNVRQDDVVSTEIARRYRIRDNVLEEMKNLRKQLLAFIERITSTELDPHKYERIHSLMDRQRLFVKETRRLNNMESVQTRIHCELQRDLLHKEVDAQHKITDLKMEHVYFQAVREELENSIRAERANMADKLFVLATESNKVVGAYKEMEKAGDRILTLIAACRKLMTEKEKIVLWDDAREGENFEDTEFEKEHFKMQALDLGKHLDLTDEQLVIQANRMRNFWRRVAHVEMHNILMLQEKKRLTAENEQYCERIRNMGSQPSDRVHELKAAVTVICLRPEERPICEKLQKKRQSSAFRASGAISKSLSGDPDRKSSVQVSRKSSLKKGRSSKKIP